MKTATTYNKGFPTLCQDECDMARRESQERYLTCQGWEVFILHSPKHIVAVTGLITNDAGEVLIQLSPLRGWEFPGGRVEEGEDLIEALKREVKEETGLDVAVGQLAVYIPT